MDLDYRRLQQQLFKQSPFAQWEIVTVTFDLTETDVVIPHSLGTQHVVFLPVDQSTAASFYRDPAAARTSSTIRLRSNVAPVTVTLLLGVLAP